MINNDVVLTILRPMRKHRTWGTDTYAFVNKHEVSMAHIGQFFFICLFVLPLLWFTIKSRSLKCQNLAILTKKVLPVKYLQYGPEKFSLMGTTQGFWDRQGRPILPAQVTSQKTLWLILMRWKDLARGHC